MFGIIFILSPLLIALLLWHMLKELLNTKRGKNLKRLVAIKRIQGEIIKDLGLGSFLNAAYSNADQKIALIVLSIFAIILGIILREEKKMFETLNIVVLVIAIAFALYRIGDNSKKHKHQQTHR